MAGPDDLKGVKIRVQNNPIEVRVWKAFGAIPTPDELRRGLPGAAVGRCSTPPRTASRSSSRTSTTRRPSSSSQTEHQRNLSALYISEKKLASLPRRPAEDRAGGRRSRRRPTSARRTRELVAAAADRLKAKGAVLTTPDKTKFIALIAPIQDEVAEELKPPTCCRSSASTRSSTRATAWSVSSHRLERVLEPVLTGAAGVHHDRGVHPGRPALRFRDVASCGARSCPLVRLHLVRVPRHRDLLLCATRTSSFDMFHGLRGRPGRACSG